MKQDNEILVFINLEAFVQGKVLKVYDECIIFKKVYN